MPDVASVAGRPIPLSRLEERVAEMRRSPRARHMPPDGGGEAMTLRRWVVQELVTDAVIEHEARAAGLVSATDAARSEWSTRLEPSLREALVSHVTSDVGVGEDEARRYYERNADLYVRPEGRRVRHVLVAREELAHEMRGRIDRGEDMAELAGLHSIDTGTRERGGDLGMLRRGELSGELEDAVFGASAGDVVGPVRTGHGWHIARIESVVPASVVPFEAARDEIEAYLLEDARRRAFAGWVERRRAELAVVDPAYEHPGHPLHGTVRHRH